MKWLLNQLGKVIPDTESPDLEMSKQSSQIEAQVVLMQEALILESLSKATTEMSTLLIDYPTQTVATLTPSAYGIEITVHGERLLWSEIEARIQDWRKSGNPRREQYTLSIDQQGRQVMTFYPS